MSRRVRLAFVGCGQVTTEVHLPALRRVAEIEVVGLCDLDDARLQQGAKLVPQAHLYRDIGALLSDRTIDAVAVCTPPSQHADQACRVIDARKHLFVEKPLALTGGDCDAIIARAARGDTRCVVGFNLRQHRLLRAARDAIANGTLGRIELARSIFTTDVRLTHQLPGWRDTRSAGGGVLFDLATHHFDLWRWLFGAEVVEVSTVSRSGASDDTAASVTLGLSGGELATIQMAERTTPLHQIDVFGERARLRVSLYDFDGLEVILLASRPGSLGARVRSVLRTLRELPAGVLSLTRGGDFAATYERQWRRFAATVLRGDPPAATLEDGRAAARIAIAAAESARLGRPVTP